jgi:hypothetical protein
MNLQYKIAVVVATSSYAASAWAAMIEVWKDRPNAKPVRIWYPIQVPARDAGLNMWMRPHPTAARQEPTIMNGAK